MPVFKELRFYDKPEGVGYVASIETAAGLYFVKNDGQIMGPYINGELVGQDAPPAIAPPEERPDSAPVSAETPAEEPEGE